jgi:hypothetical protein
MIKFILHYIISMSNQIYLFANVGDPLIWIFSDNKSDVI